MCKFITDPGQSTDLFGQGSQLSVCIKCQAQYLEKRQGTRKSFGNGPGEFPTHGAVRCVWSGALGILRRWRAVQLESTLRGVGQLSRTVYLPESRCAWVPGRSAADCLDQAGQQVSEEG